MWDVVDAGADFMPTRCGCTLVIEPRAGKHNPSAVGAITSSYSSNLNDRNGEIREREEGNRLRRKSSHVPEILGVQTIEETEERKCDANHCFQYPPT